MPPNTALQRPDARGSPCQVAAAPPSWPNDCAAAQSLEASAAEDYDVMPQPGLRASTGLQTERSLDLQSYPVVP